MKFNTAKLMAAGLVLVMSIGISGAAFAAKAKVKKVDNMQLTYQLYAFNGKGYGETFVPQPEGSFRLIAGANNVISPKVADVQWSDESGEWIADWSNWDHPATDVGDRLEILKGNKVIKTVGKDDVAMYFPDANATEFSVLVVGKAARDAFKRYTKENDEYYAASSLYSEEKALYDEQVAKLKEANPNAVLPAEPVKPEQPKFSISQPIKAFVINIEPGNYKVRTLDKFGKILANSVKKLQGFEHRRTGIGYSIKPETKWTYPEENDDRTNIIYYVGKTELFFNPMIEQEFNVRDYSKLNKPSSPFMNNAPKDQWVWIQIKPKTEVGMKLYKNGKLIQDIPEKPWIVVQTSGAALGYNILEWKAGEFKETAPHFKAHQVILKDKGVFGIELVDKAGKPVPGGYREARPVKEFNSAILFAVSLVPFVFGLVVSLIRGIQTRSQFKSTGA